MREFVTFRRCNPAALHELTSVDSRTCRGIHRQSRMSTAYESIDANNERGLPVSDCVRPRPCTYVSPSSLSLSTLDIYICGRVCVYGCIRVIVITIIIIIGVSLMHRPERSRARSVSITRRRAEFTRNPSASPSSLLITLINLTRYSPYTHALNMRLSDSYDKPVGKLRRAEL